MEIIKKYREFMGLRQVDLANKLKVKRTVINNLECGKSPLTLEFAKSIYKEFGLDEYRLYTDIETTEKKSIIALLYILTKSDYIFWEDISDYDIKTKHIINSAIYKVEEFNFYNGEDISFTVDTQNIAHEGKCYVCRIEGAYYVLKAFNSKLSTVDWILFRINLDKEYTVRLINSCLVNDGIRELLRAINNNEEDLSEDLYSLLDCVLK